MASRELVVEEVSEAPVVLRATLAKAGDADAEGGLLLVEAVATPGEGFKCGVANCGAAGGVGIVVCGVFFSVTMEGEEGVCTLGRSSLWLLVGLFKATLA